MPANVDLEYALKLLSLPREVGKHPETGKPITANFGRYGPYVAHDGQYASLEFAGRSVHRRHQSRGDAAGREEGEGRRPRGAEALKELGADPDGGATIKVMKGRYGPYVTDGTINATMPNDADPMTRHAGTGASH